MYSTIRNMPQKLFTFSHKQMGNKLKQNTFFKNYKNKKTTKHTTKHTTHKHPIFQSIAFAITAKVKLTRFFPFFESPFFCDLIPMIGCCNDTDFPKFALFCDIGLFFLFFANCNSFSKSIPFFGATLLYYTHTHTHICYTHMLHTVHTVHTRASHNRSKTQSKFPRGRAITHSDVLHKVHIYVCVCVCFVCCVQQLHATYMYCLLRVTCV